MYLLNEFNIVVDEWTTRKEKREDVQKRKYSNIYWLMQQL
jgi:hypothetical protein